jgi:hypothetical protein
MIINVSWEFDLRYNAAQGEFKKFGIESLHCYLALDQKGRRKVYENFATANNVPLSVDLSRYWREPEHAYKEDITEFLKDKWGYSVKSWSKVWCIDDHLEMYS